MLVPQHFIKDLLCVSVNHLKQHSQTAVVQTCTGTECRSRNSDLEKPPKARTRLRSGTSPITLPLTHCSKWNQQQQSGALRYTWVSPGSFTAAQSPGSAATCAEHNPHPACPQLQDRPPPAARLADFILHLLPFHSHKESPVWAQVRNLRPPRAPPRNPLPRGEPTWRRDAPSPPVFLPGAAARAEKRTNKRQQQKGRARRLHLPAGEGISAAQGGLRAGLPPAPAPAPPPFAGRPPLPLPDPSSHPRLRVWEHFCPGLKGAGGFSQVPLHAWRVSCIWIPSNIPFSEGKKNKGKNKI